MMENPFPKRFHVDILYHILSHLTPDTNPNSLGSFNEASNSDAASARKALARLARVHTSFTNPALAVLWRCIPSKEPLEDLLCAIGIARRLPQQQEHLPPSVELCGSPATNEAAWLRFQEYAALVREIAIDPFIPSVRGPAKLLEDTFWRQLSSAVGDQKILPHLKGITLRSMLTFYPIDMGVFRLLDPSIRELRIVLPQANEEELKRVKKALVTSFSLTENLEHLSMEVSDPTLVLDVELLPRSHPHLRYLRLDSIQLKDLRPLAALPHLESLSFTFKGSWEHAGLPIIFSELHSLAISCTEFSGVHHLFTHVEFPQLQTFSLSEEHTEFNSVSEMLPGHIRTLLAKSPSLTAFAWSSYSLQKFSIGYRGNPQSAATLADLVAPLLSHHTLRRFAVQLDDPHGVLYTPADLRAFAAAWPDLEAFHLGPSGYGTMMRGSGRYVDLDSVFGFARNCPRLRCLDLPMLVEDNSDALVKPAGRPSAPHWLRELSAVVFIRDEEWAGDRRHTIVGQFHDLMREVFPLVTLRIQFRRRNAIASLEH